MQELNEYQKKCNAKAVEFHDLLQPIVDQMPEGWSLRPIKLDDTGHAMRCHYIANAATGLEIMARYDEYDIRGRMEFQAIQWPKYHDENGADCTKHPGDCYQPRETAPRTTAATGREPKAIANQIVNKVIPDYERIFERCQGLAAESQKYHDETKDAIDRLTEATGDDRHSTGRRTSGWYLQGLPGSQRIDFNSVGDIRISLGVEDMLDVIDLLYRKRTGKGRSALQYWACEECGCTDIQGTAWIDLNSDMPNQDEPPTDYGFCPQCELATGDGSFKMRCELVDERKPFEPATDAQSQLFELKEEK